ncbi:MAG: hypothetical protein Q4D04_12645, partial [Clostridia bacterium]|nr:hypothetical protein [Clostridia bacterium]
DKRYKLALELIFPIGIEDNEEEFKKEREKLSKYLSEDQRGVFSFYRWSKRVENGEVVPTIEGASTAEIFGLQKNVEKALLQQLALYYEDDFEWPENER